MRAEPEGGETVYGQAGEGKREAVRTPRTYQIRCSQPAALHDIACQQGNDKGIIHGPAVLFIGQTDFGRLVFKRKRPAGVKVKRQRQHQRHKAVVRCDHDVVGIKSVGRGGVQLRRKPRGTPAHKAAAQIRERIPDGQRCGGGGRPHTEEHHAHAPQYKHTGALGPQHAGRAFFFGLPKRRCSSSSPRR